MYQRCEANTGIIYFQNEIPIQIESPPVIIVQFDTDKRCHLHQIDIEFKKPDGHSHHINIAEGSSFSFDPDASIHQLLIKRFMFHSYKEAIHAAHTNDVSNGRWTCKAYTTIPPILLIQ